MDNLFAPYECQFSILERKDLIAQTLKELRTVKGYQQKELAEILAIPPQTYNGYEKGRNEPPIEILVRLSFLYDVPMDLLTQRNIFVKPDSIESAKRQIDMYEKEIASMQEEFKNSPYSQNKQLQAFINGLDNLTKTLKRVLPKDNDDK